MTRIRSARVGSRGPEAPGGATRRVRNGRRPWAVAVGLLCWAATAVWAVDRPTVAPGGGESIEGVRRLIENSSGAEQIKASGDEAALAKQNEAREILARAQAAQQKGQAEEAKRLLGQATRTMFEAVRLAKAPAVVADKQRADFKRRLQSLEELLKADERISREKRGEKAVAQTDDERAIRDDLAQARALFEAGQLEEARAALDRAYAGAKAAIERLRNGDTLVRSLHFDSKKEEYRYELDRNETHRVLLSGLVNQRAERPGLEKQVQPFVERGADLRRQGEAAAAAGDHAKGIELIEQSTEELIRGIRAAGVFLPG